MSAYATLDTAGDPGEAARSLFRGMLEKGLVDAVLTPARGAHSALPMPTLFTSAQGLEMAEPLAPAASLNAARQVAIAARRSSGRTMAVMLRPCERRAVIELAKLDQCAFDDLVIVSMDCHGRLENADYLARAGEDGFTAKFLSDAALQAQITTTCGSCVDFTPEGADLALHVFGFDPTKAIGVAGEGERGERILAGLELGSGSEPGERAKAAQDVKSARDKARSKVFAAIREKTNNMPGLQEALGACIKCYNCRSACPVCYCRDCVFNSDVFGHDPDELLRRADRKGPVRMPMDVTMYHLTRMAHMAHACVGCGQCSSVCPSDIPVADLFRSVASKVQGVYGYKAGRDVEEPIPYRVFGEASKEEEHA